MDAENDVNISEERSESEVSKIEPKKSILNDILELLKRSKYGRNISQIANKLNLSRNTVKRYLKYMEKELLIEVKEIGRSKIAYFKKNYEADIARGYIAYILEFYNSMLKGIEKVSSRIPNHEDVLNELGNEMGKHLQWPPLEAIAYKKDKKMTLIQAANILIQFLDLFNSVFKMVKVEMIPPISVNPHQVMFRIENISPKVDDSIFFYEISLGFFETKVREICGDEISLSIVEYRKRSSCCYCKMEMNSEKVL
ncbi:MAG: HTH domain-containing protein [Candidatus Helarchaeota archaeon]